MNILYEQPDYMTVGFINYDIMVEIKPKIPNVLLDSDIENYIYNETQMSLKYDSTIYIPTISYRQNGQENIAEVHMIIYP